VFLFFLERFITSMHCTIDARWRAFCVAAARTWRTVCHQSVSRSF